MVPRRRARGVHARRECNAEVVGTCLHNRPDLELGMLGRAGERGGWMDGWLVGTENRGPAAEARYLHR